jgi:hypothetical protein
VLPGASPNPLFLRQLKEVATGSALHVDGATTPCAE